MAKRQSEPTHEDFEAVPLAESEAERVDEFTQVLTDWITTADHTQAVDHLAHELRLVGIDTVAKLAQGNVELVRRAIVAALRLDAQSLTGAAAEFIGRIK